MPHAAAAVLLLLSLAADPPAPARGLSDAVPAADLSAALDVAQVPAAAATAEEAPLQGSVMDELPPDKRAKAHYERTSCRRDKPGLCYEIALEYEPDGPTPDPAIAAAVYERACAFGHFHSCALLALQYTDGRGVRTHYKRAARLYERACLEGPIPAACNNLGLLYGSGLGVPLDVARSVVFFRKACELGNELGCKNVRAAEEPPHEPPVENQSFAALPEAKRRRVQHLLQLCTRDAATRTRRRSGSTSARASCTRCSVARTSGGCTSTAAP